MSFAEWTWWPGNLISMSPDDLVLVSENTNQFEIVSEDVSIVEPNDPLIFYFADDKRIEIFPTGEVKLVGMALNEATQKFWDRLQKTAGWNPLLNPEPKLKDEEEEDGKCCCEMSQLMTKGCTCGGK